MFTSIVQIVAFVVETLFDVYILLLLLRLLLQISGANFYNPVVQMLVKLTNPLVKPAVRFIPRWRNVDYSILLVTWLLAILQIIIVLWIRYDKFPGVLAIIAWSVGEVCDQLLNIYFYGLIIYILGLWLNAQRANPFFEVLYWLCNPILRPLQRIIPKLGRWDFSPIIALIIIKSVQLFLIVPLIKWALVRVIPV